jgi:hypothetical protein
MSAVTEIAAGVAGSSALSYQLTLTGSAAVGDLVVVIGGNSNTNALASSAVTDSQGNTWTLAKATTQASATRAGVWYSVLTTALTGGTDWVKLTTSSGSNSWKTLLVWKLTPATSISLDKINSHDTQPTNTAMTPGTTGTLTQTLELAVALYQYANASSPAFTATAGWSQTATTQQIAGGTTVNALSAQYQITAATTALNPSATISQTNTYGAAIATFAFTATVTTNTTLTATQAQTATLPRQAGATRSPTQAQTPTVIKQTAKTLTP